MMFDTMWQSQLYLPVYVTRPTVGRDAVLVAILNANRPSTWDQVTDYLDKNGSISNKEVREIMGGEGVLEASKQIRDWVQKGLLVVTDPSAAKQNRRYTKPSTSPGESLFSKLAGKRERGNG